MTSKQYLNNQFKRLQKTQYGFSIKIFDGVGNETNRMELTPNRAREIIDILESKADEDS